MRYNGTRLAIGLGAVLLMIAGCSSGSAASSSPAATTVVTSSGAPASNSPTAATTSSAVAPASAGAGGGPGTVEDGIGHPVSVCDLLPVATVASVSGEPLTKAEEDDTTAYKIYACNYSSTDGTAGLRVSVLALDAAPGYDGTLAAAGSGATQISGLGDKAFSSILGVEALFGNVSITVSNLQSDSAAETLIRDLQPKL